MQKHSYKYILVLELSVQVYIVITILFDNCSFSIMKAEVAKVKHLQSELDAKTEEVNKLTRQQVRYIYVLYIVTRYT